MQLSKFVDDVEIFASELRNSVWKIYSHRLSILCFYQGKKTFVEDRIAITINEESISVSIFKFSENKLKDALLDSSKLLVLDLCRDGKGILNSVEFSEG